MSDQNHTRFSLKGFMLYVTWLCVWFGVFGSYMHLSQPKMSPRVVLFTAIGVGIFTTPFLLYYLVAGLSFLYFRRGQTPILIIPVGDPRKDQCISIVFLPVACLTFIILLCQGFRRDGGSDDYLPFLAMTLVIILFLIRDLCGVRRIKEVMFTEDGVFSGFVFTAWRRTAQVDWYIHKHSCNIKITGVLLNQRNVDIPREYKDQVEAILRKTLEQKRWFIHKRD